MIPRSKRPAAALLMVTLFTACSGPASTTPPSASPTSTPSPTSAAPATPTATPTTSSAPTPAPRSDAQLSKALLTTGDLPSGYDKRAAVSAAESGITVTGKGAACVRLANLLQAERVSGSTATAGASFGRGDEGPAVDQSLDAVADGTAAGAVVHGYAEAAAGCKSLEFELRGSGSSTLDVSVLKTLRLGDASIMFGLKTKGGDVDGLSLIQVVGHSDDIVLGLVFNQFSSADADQLAEKAMSKVRKRLDRR